MTILPTLMISIYIYQYTDDKEHDVHKDDNENVVNNDKPNKTTTTTKINLKKNPKKHYIV